MSIFNRFITQFSILKKKIIHPVCLRTITTGFPSFCEAAEGTSEVYSESETELKEVDEVVDPRIKVVHPLEKCLEYMSSKAYQITYGEKPVWHVYVRNFKGNLPPRTRKNCYFGNFLKTSSPCPICRDQYLLADYRNVKLLKQFVSPYGEEILNSKTTGVCQKQQKALTVAIKKARNYGLLTYSVPHRVYDYSLYNKK